MTARRSSQLNYLDSYSDRTSLIGQAENNAEMTGSDYGFMAVERDLGRMSIRVRYYDSDGNAPEDGTLLAESDEVSVSALPATVTLNEASGSGVSGTVDIAGVR